MASLPLLVPWQRTCGCLGWASLPAMRQHGLPTASPQQRDPTPDAVAQGPTD